MKSRTIRESDRFNINHPTLCPALRWKGQFILAQRDPTVPAGNDGLFWCLHSQTCIGPDGELAEKLLIADIGTTGPAELA